MKVLTKLVAGMTTSAALFGAWGCGGSTSGRPSVSSSTATAKVSGTVTFKGKPATKGTLTFDGANVERKMVAPVTVEIGKDGSFSLETVVGGNVARISNIPGFNPGMDINSAQIPVEVTEGMAPLTLEFPHK